jgi:hypothetical protein
VKGGKKGGGSNKKNTGTTSSVPESVAESKPEMPVAAAVTISTHPVSESESQSGHETNARQQRYLIDAAVAAEASRELINRMNGVLDLLTVIRSHFQCVGSHENRFPGRSLCYIVNSAFVVSALVVAAIPACILLLILFLRSLNVITTVIFYYTAICFSFFFICT